MTYGIIIRSSAKRDLRALPPALRRRVSARIDALALDPRGPDTEPLRGVLRGWRKARVGDYRIGYEVVDQDQAILIRAIGHRHNVYPEMTRRQADS